MVDEQLEPEYRLAGGHLGLQGCMHVKVPRREVL